MRADELPIFWVFSRRPEVRRWKRSSLMHRILEGIRWPAGRGSNAVVLGVRSRTAGWGTRGVTPVSVVGAQIKVRPVVRMALRGRSRETGSEEYAGVDWSLGELEAVDSDAGR